MHRRGFTLIELLVVISIIGLLSSIVLSSLSTARAKARDAQRMRAMVELRTAIENYYSDNGFYPLCNAGSNGNCTSIGYQGDIKTLAVVPKYISSIAPDPINISGQYGYYYVRGWRVTNPTMGHINTGKDTDYVLATRLESKPVLGYGWNSAPLNIMFGTQ